jgi:hypothetical protein
LARLSAAHLIALLETMYRAWIETRLALAERHVAESRERISRQRIRIANLERSEHAHSLTANMARDLLQSLKDELAMHIADRERLRHWIAKARAAAGRPAHRKAVGPVAANTRNNAASDR